MTSYQNGQHAINVAALADEDLDAVIGGCVGVPVVIKGGEIIYVSPTTGFPNPNGGHMPYFPFPKW